MRNYFLIFYVARVSHGTVYGIVSYETPSVFPNNEQIHSLIARRQKFNDVVITNIVKLTEDEYYEWRRTDVENSNVLN